MEDKRFALLIDAENISGKYIKIIMDEITNEGSVTYKRIMVTGRLPTSKDGRTFFWKTPLPPCSSTAILPTKVPPIPL